MCSPMIRWRVIRGIGVSASRSFHVTVWAMGMCVLYEKKPRKMQGFVGIEKD